MPQPEEHDPSTTVAWRVAVEAPRPTRRFSMSDVSMNDSSWYIDDTLDMKLSLSVVCPPPPRCGLLVAVVLCLCVALFVSAVTTNRTEQ